jgi:ribosome-binding factor A
MAFDGGTKVSGRAEIHSELKARSGGKGKRRRMMAAETMRRAVASEIAYNIEDLALRATVSRVTVSPDLENATVYIMVGLGLESNPEQEHSTIETLIAHKPQIKDAILRVTRLRRFRDIHFKIDRAADKLNSVCDLIDRVSGV